MGRREVGDFRGRVSTSQQLMSRKEVSKNKLCAASDTPEEIKPWVGAGGGGGDGTRKHKGVGSSLKRNIENDARGKGHPFCRPKREHEKTNIQRNTE